MYCFQGAAKIENVEFAYTGQEGFTNSYDPRFSIAFVATGPGSSTDLRPSFVKGCAFHHGFNTAVGIFGASGVVIEKNVIHRVVGEGKSNVNFMKPYSRTMSLRSHL